MKNLFVMLTLGLTFSATLHSNETTAFSTNTTLVTHIKAVNIEAFTNELQELITLNPTATTPYITSAILTELEQCAIETKQALEHKLTVAMAQDENINWKELIKGSGICLPSGFLTVASLGKVLSGIGIKHTNDYETNRYSLYITPTIFYALITWLSSETFLYGAQITNDGLNYQAQLRTNIKGLNSILAFIQQAKTQIFI